MGTQAPGTQLLVPQFKRPMFDQQLQDKKRGVVVLLSWAWLSEGVWPCMVVMLKTVPLIAVVVSASCSG